MLTNTFCHIPGIGIRTEKKVSLLVLLAAGFFF